MPIQLSTIPELLLVSIVQKQTIQSFVRFSQCSRASYDIANGITTRIVARVDAMCIQQTVMGSIVLTFPKKTVDIGFFLTAPVQFSTEYVIFLGYLTKELGQAFEAIFLENSFPQFHLKAEFTAENTCTPEDFNDLLSVMRPDAEAGELTHTLTLHSVTNPDYLGIPAINNLCTLTAKSSVNDDGIRFLKIPKLELSETYVSGVGINVLVREWFNMQRKIVLIRIETNVQLEEEVMMLGIPYSEGWDEKYSEVFIVERVDEQRLSVGICEVTGRNPNTVFEIKEMPVAR